MNNFNKDILLEILKNIPLNEYLNFCLVSKLFSNSFKQGEFWKNKFLIDFEDPSNSLVSQQNNFYLLYKKYYQLTKLKQKLGLRYTIYDMNFITYLKHSRKKTRIRMARMMKSRS